MIMFVDKCMNRHLLRHLTGHLFVHPRDTLLLSTQNGALLRAVSSHYDVFLTRDRNIPFQQNLKRYSLALVVLRARLNRIEDLLPLAPELLATLGRFDTEGFVPGEFHEIAAK